MCPVVDKAKQTAATVEGKIEQGKDFIKGKIDDTVGKGIDKVNGVVDPHLDKAVNTFNNSKAGLRLAAANNRAQGIADGLNGFTKSADAKTAGMRNTLGKATDTLNEFNSAGKYGDAFGFDAGKIADGIKGFGSKPAEKETKAPEGKAGKKESEQGESAESAKDLIKAAEKVAEVKGGETESAVAEEKPLSRGEELRQKYGHLSPEERKALLAQKLEENRERREKEGQEREQDLDKSEEHIEIDDKLVELQMALRTDQVDRAVDSLSQNKIRHIINGSRGNNHRWELVTNNSTWEEIKPMIKTVLKEGVPEHEGIAQNVYKVKKTIRSKVTVVMLFYISSSGIRVSDEYFEKET